MNELLFFGVCLLCAVNGFVHHTSSSSTSKINAFNSFHTQPPSSITSRFIYRCNALPPGDELEPEPIAVTINSTLSDTNTKKLFAWIKCAFDQSNTDKDDVYAYYYNNIELAIAAASGITYQVIHYLRNC